ncbi:alpha/beta hydrolase family esterase [Corynebacterium cystitidis]|nr:PHB depolymerase family esterase [Corynebacterium cystitidis]
MNRTVRQTVRQTMGIASWKAALVAVLSSLSIVGVAACGFPFDDEELRDSNDAFVDLESDASQTTAAQPEAPESQTIGEPTTTAESVTVDGKKRTFSLTVPPEATDGARLPLIFVFHGMNESSEAIRDYSNLDLARAYVVYLDGVDKAWAPAPYAATTGEEDLAFVDAVREKIIAEHNVDTARVFATGLSNGGGFAAYIGCQRPVDFTAVATVSAAYYWKVSEKCSSIPMKLLDIHGTDDKVVSYEGGNRHDTAYHSVPEILEDAADRNHCSDSISITQLWTNGIRQVWDDCDAPLEHVRVGSGTHTWPGGEKDPNESTPNDIATKEILKFFGVSMRGS